MLKSGKHESCRSERTKWSRTDMCTRSNFWQGLAHRKGFQRLQCQRRTALSESAASRVHGPDLDKRSLHEPKSNQDWKAKDLQAKPNTWRERAFVAMHGRRQIVNLHLLAFSECSQLSQATRMNANHRIQNRSATNAESMKTDFYDLRGDMMGGGQFCLRGEVRFHRLGWVNFSFGRSFGGGVGSIGSVRSISSFGVGGGA